MSRLRLIAAGGALLALTVACASTEPSGATAEDIQAAMDAARPPRSSNRSSRA